ncbi:MAG: MnhB domain-containing protein [Elusimicrobiota bacterium]|nr:MnhB domain-containing protein [Elusimicrobiota bacterium]
MIKKPEQGMTIIVKTITRYTVGLILLYGIYIVLHGHLTPGGGFAGGVIVALSFIHLMLAFGKETALKKMSEKLSSVLESLGAIMFVTIAIIGLAVSGFLFFNFLTGQKPNIESFFNLFSSGIIPLCNIAICLKVGAGLFGIFVALVFFKLTTKDD